MKHCDCGLAKWWGQQEFAIPQNVLEIVYGQTICWIGTFYSPMLPAICTIKYFFIFYIKKVISRFCFFSSRVKLKRQSRFLILPFCCLFTGLIGEQLSSSHTSLQSLQLQLLLPGCAAHWPGSGLSACQRQCSTVSNALLIQPVSSSHI